MKNTRAKNLERERGNQRACEKSVERATDVLKFFAARLHAGVTDFGADAAVLMVACMTAAFLRASAARNDAALQDAADHVVTRFRPARGDRAGDRANLGTVKVQANAVEQWFGRRLGETGVRASRAGLSGVVAGFDAADDGLVGLAPDSRMAADHLPGVHGNSSTK